jgi:quercetin dioxygenase-like cupin family protein
MFRHSQNPPNSPEVEVGIRRDKSTLHTGYAVEIPCNVKPWHGAAKDSWFVRIAIEANTKARPQ